MAILDSGERRNFDSGAVRDLDDSKGRCDLLPLGIISISVQDPLLSKIHQFLYMGTVSSLYDVLSQCRDLFGYRTMYDMYLDVSKHYAEGAKKYEERNWERGIPVHSFIDSATRHYLKWRSGWDDENHYLSLIWNILGAIWTYEVFPDLRDIPALSPNAENANCIGQIVYFKTEEASS